MGLEQADLPPDLEALAAQVKMRRQAVKGAQRELATMLFQPPAAAEGLIVYFPGGGFIADELEACELFCRVLAARVGLTVLASSYTLATELPFPAAVEDAHAVLSWAGRYCKRKGWKSPRLIVAGLEAGGNLAAVSALMARDRGGPALAAQILMMPMLDPGLTTCSMRTVAARNGGVEAANACAKAYRGYLPHAIDRAHPYASPLQSSRMKHLPPALILSADDDPLRDEAEHYGAKLIAAGVPTTVRRLAPIALDDPDARCSCARKESALHEVESFIAGLRADV
ncbi:alpha/beta hydrolase [Noviherbaspirillum sp. CPCC 100848]|uniref:Alpha/beta hydrolase n=1 Tax=Noviherbaspirillum album TaxID=3080276 RepID=A0ABU6JAJ2_9BURK|nr:alpha/beta hydrolase [Noviherbaspirillum sp. CPCC 100848]MEC4720555.1 alpha/beta hydrolase [Noviherbaspirillum sp. CPCC 100848]